MPRALPADLDAIMLSPVRRPGYIVEVYDVRSTSDTINDIVVGNPLQLLTGPRDITADCRSVQIDEKAGDFAGRGVAGTSIIVRISDPNGIYDPYNLVADPESDGRWLRRNNVIRIREGDVRVNSNLWPITFTGLIVGQPGINLNRTNTQASVEVKAVDRSIGYLRYKNTSQVFTKGNAYIDIGRTIATDDMGLDLAEIDFANWGSQVNQFEAFQTVDEETLVSIAKLMFIDGFMPYFTGEGKLSQTFGIVTKGADRIYTDDGIFRSFVTPFSEIEVTNYVEVLGLDPNMSRVNQKYQTLKEVTLTVGFFTQDEEFYVYWRDDRSMLASNVSLEVIKSVNGGLWSLGTGGEEITLIPGDTGEGFKGCILKVSTGFAPWLVVALTVSYIAAAFIPDLVVAGGFLANFGETIPIGRYIQALLLVQIITAMQQIGRGVYEIKGKPFEFVFKEIRGIAELKGTLTQDQVQLTIENQAVQSQSEADNTARNTLFREIVKGQPRQVEMLHDLKLIPDDVFERSNNRTYIIDTISRTLIRQGAEVVARLGVYETTPDLPV